MASKFSHCNQIMSPYVMKMKKTHVMVTLDGIKNIYFANTSAFFIDFYKKCKKCYIYQVDNCTEQ